MPEQQAIENLLFYDPQFESYAEGFREQHPFNGIAHAVTSPNELIEAVKGYAMVKSVELVLHGSPGSIWFKGGGVMTGSYFGTIASAANMLAMDARVLFLGCNIAEGPAGDKFLTEVGKNMFAGTGGVVGGTTVTNVVFKGGASRMNPLMFFGAKLKVRWFDMAGKMTAGQDVGYFGGTTNINVK
ncbi:MAG: DUF4347 domain-containing protein [bacterium]|nr:DUF4347 domain-containing protein [bacterium]